MTLCGLPGALGRAAFDPCGLCTAGCDDEDDSLERQQLRQTARRIGALLDRLQATGDLDELWTVLTTAFRDGRDVLLSWFDLLEQIVQIAEQRYGSESGRGRFKAAQVKAALRRVIRESSSPSRDAVIALGPGALDLVLDAGLGIIVGLLNRRRTLWTTGGLGLPPKRPPLRTRILLRLVRWFGAVYAWFQVKEPLDQALYDEVAGIVQKDADPLTIVDKALDAARWVGEHRTTVEALMEIVAISCDEAEYFGRLTGSEKQAYARDLILVVLEEEFGIVFRGPMLVLAESVIEFVIDFVVSVNNRRGAFVHQAA